MSPESRFSKKSKKRYKALLKIVRGFTPPEGAVLIVGRTAGIEAPYVEVVRFPHRGQKVYFDGKIEKKWVRRELGILGVR